MTDPITIDRDVLAQAHDALTDATCIVPPNHPDYRAIMDALKAARGAMHASRDADPPSVLVTRDALQALLADATEALDYLHLGHNVYAQIRVENIVDNTRALLGLPR